MKTPSDITERLEHLRAELRAERISYGELHELQCLGEQGHIPEHDVELREAAGLPEFPEEQANHTPGEWLVGINSNTGTDCLEIYARGGQMTVCAGLGNGPEAEANARLIAAAPALLEACQFALKFCEHERKETGGAIAGSNCHTLRRAISQATGKE